MNYDTLVLSGGGIKGMFLLGAIEACSDLNMLSNIKTFVATSIGSIISYLLIIGYTPMELLIELHKNKWLEKIQMNIPDIVSGNSVINYIQISDIIEKLTLSKAGKFFTMSSLEQEFDKKLVCCTYNMTKCKLEYISSDNYPDIPCITALRMSSNLPFVFDRFKYMNSYYIDGGISDNFPIEYAQEHGSKILGIYIKLSDSSLQDRPEEGNLKYLLKLIQIPMMHLNNLQIERLVNTDKNTIIAINGNTDTISLNFSTTNTERMKMFIEGYDSVKTYMFDEKD